MSRRALTTLLATALLAGLLSSTAQADFGLREFDVTFSDESGAGQALAGSHPYEMQVDLAANLDEALLPQEFPEDAVKDLEISQVPGFIGDLTAVPPCPTLDFLTGGEGNTTACSDSSIAGIVAVRVSQKGGTLPRQYSPLYNLDPTPGSVARFGFITQGVPVVFSASPDEKPPYVVIAHTRGVSQVLEFNRAQVTLWGVPADPSHDPLRGGCLAQVPNESGVNPEGPPVSLGDCPAGLSPRPFITLPRSCTGPLESRYATDSWQNPGPYLPNGNPDLSDPRWVQGSVETHDDAVPPNPQGMVGCGSLGFSPVTSAEPTTANAESASGLGFTIDVEDEGLKDEDGRAQADIEAVRVELPAGVTANPSAAEGLGVCSAEQFAAEELDDDGCPDASKLGTVEAQTPILENHPLRGSLYLASQQDNPFDSLLALYIVVRDQDLGVFVKLAARVEADPVTGRLVTTAEDLPPFPLSRVEVKLRSGPRAPLITPPNCGTYTTLATLYPSSGKAPLNSSSSFEIDSGPGGGPCPQGLPFSPGFEAGAISNAAGAYSPFSLRMTRKDGEQDITRLQVELPPGEVAKLAGVSSCPDAAIEAAKARTGREELTSPSCPAASKIGALTGGAGVGTDLTWVPGSLYLAGPYNGAPLSVAAVVPAVAGPFDVGTVVTRIALRIDPRTAEVTVDGQASDPIPHILEGIPLKVRDIRAFTDRPEFSLNPTSCDPSQTVAQLWGGGANPFSSLDDSPVSAASRFQAAGCASLGFKPRLSLKLKGGTKRGGHPALTGTYAPRPGDANLAGLVLRLPRSAFLDQAHIRTICTRVQFAANSCPAGAIYGNATAYTPLLDQPLSGPVYLRSSDHNLPDFVADLHGLIDVEAVARIDSKGGGIRASFSAVPDAPLTKVVVRMQGAKKGLIVNSTDLCRSRHRANARFSGHNGKVVKGRPVMRASCGGK